MTNPFVYEPNSIEIGSLVRIHPQHLMYHQMHTVGEIGIVVDKYESLNTNGFWYYTVLIMEHGRVSIGWSSLEIIA